MKQSDSEMFQKHDKCQIAPCYCARQVEPRTVTETNLQIESDSILNHYFKHFYKSVVTHLKLCFYIGCRFNAGSEHEFIVVDIGAPSVM